MNMRCSKNMYASNERKRYVEESIEVILKHYRVPKEDRKRFLDTNEIWQIKRMLRSVNMSIRDIEDYLGESFYMEWMGEDQEV